MRCAKHFMTNFVAAYLASRLYLKSKKALDKPESMLFFWKGVVNHFFEMYASYHLFTESEMQIQNIKQPSNMTTNQYAEALWTKALRCNQGYTGYALMGIFVKELPSYIYNSISSY